jgi:SAM-dependent MidA family methyltransferase
MSNEIIKLAQADSSIGDNLAATDSKMVNLNKELAGLLDQYEKINFSQSSQSFFSFENPYFWVLLFGLFLLAIGLLLLLKELKENNVSSRQEKIEAILNPKEVIAPKEIVLEPEPVEEEKVVEKKSATPRASSGQTKRKAIKIKVVKVK